MRMLVSAAPYYLLRMIAIIVTPRAIMQTILMKLARLKRCMMRMMVLMEITLRYGSI